MDLTNEQKLWLEDLISKRMEDFGEDRRTACFEVNKYIINLRNYLQTHNP